MRIVGVAVFPSFSRGSFAATDLGSGAAVQAAVLSEPSPQTGCAGRTTCYNFYLLRYRPKADARADGARLQAAVTAAGCPPGSCTVTADQRPSDIRNYTGVRDTPLVLGAVLALLAVATLIHVLLTSVRRRRRDLAVLKSLGLLPSQVLGTVLWQASALAAASLLVGLPLGVLAGRWAWVLFADSAGVAPEGRHPGHAGAGRHPGHAAAGDRDRNRPWMGGGPNQPGHRTARRISGPGWRRPGCTQTRHGAHRERGRVHAGASPLPAARP